MRTPEMPPLAMSPREAFYARTETTPLWESAGRIMAEFIMVYPPGIPILLPGELITTPTWSTSRNISKPAFPSRGWRTPRCRRFEWSHDRPSKGGS